MKSAEMRGVNVVFFRESPNETFVEMVDVNVLQTLPVTAADGKYPTII